MVQKHGGQTLLEDSGTTALAQSPGLCALQHSQIAALSPVQLLRVLTLLSVRSALGTTFQDRRQDAGAARGQQLPRSSASAMALPRCVVSRGGTAWAESLEGAMSSHQSWALLCCYRCRKGATTGGLDGWGWSESKVLPASWFYGLARILSKVKGIGVWPDGLLGAYIATNPKSDGDATPLGQRPLSVLPVVYRVWASARMVQLEGWYRSWDPDAAKVLVVVAGRLWLGVVLP